jgi:hypothetical protein
MRTFAPLSVQAQRTVDDQTKNWDQLVRDGNFRELVRLLKDASTDGVTKQNAAMALRICIQQGVNKESIAAQSPCW